MVGVGSFHPYSLSFGDMTYVILAELKLTIQIRLALNLWPFSCLWLPCSEPITFKNTNEMLHIKTA